MSEQRRRLLCAAGVFLALLGLYLLTAPGRIDIVDGQWRYEVARNWLDRGEPTVTDHALFDATGRQIDRRTGKSYSSYNAAPSVTPLPVMLLSRLLPGHRVERDQFAFSLTSIFFGALLGALLIFAYGLLGIRLRESLLYTAIFCVATLWWPASVTVFDQNQHAAFLLAAVLLGWLSGRRQSLALAGLAGLLGGLLTNYQETYALLLPVAGLAVLADSREGAPGDQAALGQSPDRAALLRYLAFGLGCCVGLGLFFGYNEIRFGTLLIPGRYESQDALQAPIYGNPLRGFLGLACSPGKGILWFSPPLLLAWLGRRRMFRRAPALTLTVAGVSLCHLLVIIHLSFYGGDWCWGPRYAIPVMPLWALAFPFAAGRLRRPRRVVAPLAAVGLLIQVLGVSLDAHRFFLERNLAGWFWTADPWFYFKDSQLLARPFEIGDWLKNGVPKQARFLSSSPFEVTYCPFGSPHPEQSHLWMRHFQMFYLPRPWWGWMGRVPPQQQPVSPTALLASSLLLLAAAGTMIGVGYRACAAERRSSGDEPEPVAEVLSHSAAGIADVGSPEITDRSDRSTALAPPAPEARPEYAHEH